MTMSKLFTAMLFSFLCGLSFSTFSAENEKSTTPVRLETDSPYSEMSTDFPPWPKEVILSGESVHRYKRLYTGDIYVEIYESEPLTLKVNDFPVDEFVTVISGTLILTVAGEEPQVFEVGDSVMVPKGFTGIWEMQGNYRELLVIMNESVDNADLYAAIHAFDRAYANNEVEKYFSFYADGANVYFGNARVDIDAYHDMWTELMAAGGGVELNEMSDLKVQVMPGGNAAVSTSFIASTADSVLWSTAVSPTLISTEKL